MGVGPLKIARRHGKRGITSKQEEAMKIASALGQEVRKLFPIISHHSGVSRQKRSETDDKTQTNVKSALYLMANANQL